MSTPLFNFGGIASGLDTSTILQQLMQIERVPVVRFQQQQQALRRVDDAWAQVTTRLSAVRTAVDGLRRPEGLARHVTVTSSNDAAVSVSRTGSPATGSLVFTVERLAAAHQVAAGGTFATADALVGAGELTLTRPDGTVLGTVETGETTTLADVAARVNGLKAGISAQVVKTGEGAHRLVLSAQQTGDGSRFELGSDIAGLDTTETLRTGVDAHLKLGTLDVYRPSNTVTDLVEGVSLRLQQAGGGPVTVDAGRDLDAAVKSVKSLVDSLNATLATLGQLSAYNAETQQAGPLQGNGLVRRLVSDLRMAVSDTVEGLTGGPAHAGAVGISLTRDGALSLDETKLRAALTEDFDGVIRLFARTGSSTDARVGFLSGTDRTTAGSYAIEIDRAAKVASVTGAVYSPPAGEPKTFTITTGDGTVVSVQIDTSATDATAAVKRINDALSAAGVTALRASVDGAAIRLAESRHGSAHGFTVAGSGELGLDGEFSGEDVAGTIDGAPASGRGQTLTGPNGLVLRVTALPSEVAAAGGSLSLGAVSVTTGLGGAIDAVVRQAEGSGGSIARARESLSSEIRRFDDRIADFEIRLASRETTLRRQFTALESAMGRLQSQSAWMASQVASLNAQHG